MATNTNIRLKPLPNHGLLAAIIFMCSLAASYPTWMSYMGTAGGPGLWMDANFWNLLSGAILQLLGLGTQILGPLLLPEIFQIQLPRETKVLVWCFAAFTLLCTSTAIWLYGTFSAQWSGLVAFAGQAITGFVQLILIFGTE
jgi:hypothetical protein